MLTAMNKRLVVVKIIALVLFVTGLNVLADQTDRETDQNLLTILSENVVLKTVATTHSSKSEAVVSIYGRVIDQYGDPVANADILIDGQFTGNTTTTNGDYTISQITTGSTLSFSCDGYKTTHVIITQGGAQDDIIMELLSTP